MNAHACTPSRSLLRLLLAAALLAAGALLSGCVETIAECFEPSGRHANDAYWQQFPSDSCGGRQLPAWR